MASSVRIGNKGRHREAIVITSKAEGKATIAKLEKLASPSELSGAHEFDEVRVDALFQLASGLAMESSW